jgi:hypothetical protein
MKLDSDEILSVWTDFSQSLRPEIDSVCFYPEKELPFSKAEIFMMLMDNYSWVKNNALDFSNKNGLKIDLIETSTELSRYQDIHILYSSLAINIGYLAKFSNQIDQKYLTRFGYQVLKALNSDQSIRSISNILSEGPESDPEKEQKLIFEYFKTLEMYSALTGFNLQKLLEWNPIMTGALERLNEKK